MSARWISLSPDARYSLAWGAQLIRGDVPDVESGVISTPHPLPIALGGLASLLGTRAAADLAAFGGALSFGLLLYAAFRLGRALGGPVAGGVALVLVATRPRIDFFASRTFIDVPFAALVLLAAALAAEGPRRNAMPALGLLAAAGLLRPEAWGLALLYAGWLVIDWRRSERTDPPPDASPAGRSGPASPVALLALAGAAPATWLLFDFVLTGDPLHSLHGTQDNAVALQRATGLDDLLPSLRDGLDELVGLAPALAGAAFGVWGLVRFRQRRSAFALTCAVAGAGIGAFSVLAAADLPLNDRYLVVPALALLALAAAAVPRTWGTAVLDRVVALAAAGVLLVPAGLALPDDLEEARAAVEGAESKARADEDLEHLLGRDAVRAAIDACPRLFASASARANVAALLDRDPATVRIADRAVPLPGSAALSTSNTVPPGTPRSVRLRAWTFITRC